MKTANRALRTVPLLLAAVALAGCVSSGTPAPSSTPTSAPAASSSTAVASPAATTTATVNYRQQYLADVQPWQTAAKRAAGTGLASAAARAAGRAAVAAARRLLTQTWPASDRSDIHTLAVAFDLLNEDIVADNLTNYENDGAKLNADTNVVRADLGLPSIR